MMSLVDYTALNANLYVKKKRISQRENELKRREPL